MKRFVNGNSVQFNWLRSQIQEALQTFAEVELPDSCIPNRCRIGFEFTQTAGFKLYIDRNILYAGNHAGFRDLLSRGEASFNTYDNMIAFVRGLSCLFNSDTIHTTPPSPPQQPSDIFSFFRRTGQSRSNPIPPTIPAGDQLSCTYPVTSPRGNRMNFEFKYEKHGSVWRAFIVRSPSYGSRSSGAGDTHRLTHGDGRRYVCWTPEPQQLDQIKEVSKQWADATARYIDTGTFR